MAARLSCTDSRCPLTRRHRIDELHALREDAWISLVVRGYRLLPVRGDSTLPAGDEVPVLADPGLHAQLDATFQQSRHHLSSPGRVLPDDLEPQGAVSAGCERGRQSCHVVAGVVRRARAHPARCKAQAAAACTVWCRTREDFTTEYAMRMQAKPGWSWTRWNPYRAWIPRACENRFAAREGWPVPSRPVPVVVAAGSASSAVPTAAATMMTCQGSPENPWHSCDNSCL